MGSEGESTAARAPPAPPPRAGPAATSLCARRQVQRHVRRRELLLRPRRLHERLALPSRLQPQLDRRRRVR
eukprot:630271-Pleurochrysis_carterae.AAC.4